MDKFELERIKSHFPMDISQGIKDYADDIALLNSRYLITHRIEGVQVGYCTHCNKTGPSFDVKHNEIAFCPHCNSECRAKDRGRGRKKMLDRAYFVWYQKSQVDPEVIVATGYYVHRYYAENYKNIETIIVDEAHYIFKPGELGVMIQRDWREDWVKRKSIISLMNLTMQHVSCSVSEDSIKEAVKGTPYQYSTWEQHWHSTAYDKDGSDRLKFFEMYSLYPGIEYLTKINLGYLVTYKLQGDKTYRTINWKSNQLHKILKLTKQELREITIDGVRPSFLSLHYFQQAKKEKKALSLEEANDLTRLVPEYYQDALKSVRSHMQLKELYRYMAKQEKKMSNLSISFYRDYLSFCEKLNMDLSQTAILFPTNLKRAHDQTMRKIKIIKNEQNDKMIAARLEKLSFYTFKNDQYLIRPAKSSIEIIDEGNALSHCVGGYAGDYAKGKTDILLIRDLSNPNKPFFTMEVHNTFIRQVHGKKHKQPDKKLQEFIDQFKKQRLTKKKHKQAVSA